MIRIAQGFSALVAVALLTSIAEAQTGGTIGIEPIVTSIPPGGTFEQFYPNVFDLDHPKRLSFEGSIGNGSTSAPALVYFWSVWLAPRVPPPKDVFASPPLQIPLQPGQVITFGSTSGTPPLEFLIPFCPPQVSIHIENRGQTGPVFVEGLFIHECLIPEPATGGLAAITAAGLAVVLRTRRSRRMSAA